MEIIQRNDGSLLGTLRDTLLARGPELAMILGGAAGAPRKVSGPQTTSLDTIPRGQRIVRVGDRLQAVNDVLRNPNLLTGKGPAEVNAVLGGTPRWQVQRLGQGSRAGEGWVLREYNSSGNPTGRMIRWHPGGGHHGATPYWRVTSSEGGKSGIIPAGGEPQ